MPLKSVEKRVEILEQTVSGLSELPARVTAVEEQILQLRTEARGEFSAIRSEASAFREEMYAFREETRVQMRMLHEEAMARIRLLAEGVDATRQQLTELRATTVSKDEFQAFKDDVATFQKAVTARLSDLTEFQRDATARLADIADRLPRKRRTKRR